MIYSNYEYISAIARNRSISKAAKELFISQPYLSKILYSLEQQYHTQFFDRSSYPIKLTYAGECYLEHSKKIRNMETELSKALEDIVEENAGTIRIGTPANTGAYILPYILPVYRKRFPNVHFELFEKGSDEVLALLLAGKIDFCILTRPSYPSDIAYEYIFTEQLYLAAPKTHAIMRFQQPDRQISLLEDQNIPLLDQQSFILLPDNLSMGHLTREFLRTYHVKPEEVFTTANVQTAYRLTAQNMGFSFVSDLSLKNVQFEQSPGLFQLGENGLKRTMVAAYLQNSYIPFYARAFLQILKTFGKCFRQYPYTGVYGVNLDELEKLSELS